MGFTKLDENLLQSSIMAEDGATFKVWIALLAACKENGIAPVSAIFISSICRLSIEETIAAITKLESPDSLSRSTNDEGRRIRRVDGGYYLINYHKYREFTLSGSKEAIRQRRHREKERDNALHVTNERDISASVSASSSVSASDSSEGDARGKDKERIPPTIEEISAYCAERKNSVDPNKFFDYYTSNGWRVGKNPMRSWKAAVRTWETNSYQSVGQSGRPFVTSSRERKAAQENKEPDYPLPMLKI